MPRLARDRQGCHLSILTINNIVRPTDVPDTGLLCDLLWSDPDKEVTDWGDNDRGVSFTFGEDIVRKFNNKNEIRLPINTSFL